MPCGFWMVPLEHMLLGYSRWISSILPLGILPFKTQIRPSQEGESLQEESYKMEDVGAVQERESAAVDNSCILKEQQYSADHKVHSRTFLSFVFTLMVHVFLISLQGSALLQRPAFCFPENGWTFSESRQTSQASFLFAFSSTRKSWQIFPPLPTKGLCYSSFLSRMSVFVSPPPLHWQCPSFLTTLERHFFLP